MKKLLLSAVAVGTLFANPTVDDLQKQINDLQSQLKELKSSQANTAAKVQKIGARHYEDNINFHFGIRTSVDNLHYKTKSG